MAVPAGFDFGQCIPIEDDFRDIAEAKEQNHLAKGYGTTTAFAESEGPYYYKLFRRLIASILLDWPELTKICKNLLSRVGRYDAEDLKAILGAVRLSNSACADAYNKYKYAKDTDIPAVNADSQNMGVSVSHSSKTKDFYRLICYDTRYSGSGARRLVSFGPKVSNEYTVKILGGSQVSGYTGDSKKLYDLVFFKTVQQATAFISRISHATLNTKYELESFRYAISQVPIEVYHGYGSERVGFEISNLDDAVLVDTVCGPAYMQKKSRFFTESLHENKMPFVIIGYGSVGTRKDSAFDLSSAKERAEKMLADKFVQKVDILQHDNLVWSSKPAPTVSEAVEKHETLNPKIFDGMELKPEVKEKVEEITNTMIKLLAEEDIKLEVRDVVITGSNASYNYTKDSDIDVHILAKTSNFNDPEQVYPKLYNAYRRIFAAKYDITFYGIPVEVYIEVEGNETVSNGCYSVMFDHWVKEPSAVAIPEIDQKAIDEASKPWKERAEELLKKDDIEGIDKYIEEIYALRQKGLYSSEGVEYSTENLIFKEVRNAGLLDKIKEHRNELIGQELSLESLEEGQKIFSMQPSQRDLWDKAQAQGYVYVLTDSGQIVKDELSPWSRINTFWYDVFLSQKTYGTKWAFTREELENKNELTERLEEKDRRDFIVKIARLTHYQPVIQQDGKFEIHLVKEEDVKYVLSILRRQEWIQDCHSIPGKFDFSHVSSFSLPSRYHTVIGKISPVQKELEKEL